MSGLLYTVHWFAYTAIKYSFCPEYQVILDFTHSGLMVLLPVTGWAAESWLGRYRAIIVGLIMCTVVLLLVLVAYVVLNLNALSALMLTIIAFLFGIFGIGSLYTNMLPFTLDQMIGAPAEKLSAVVQWYCWGFNLGVLVQYIIQCLPIATLLNMFPMILLVGSSLCLSAALILDCLYHKWLDTNDKTGNPIKLIFEVLNYARWNKYPRLRSAFTYIDEEQPSRLDFGKHKFGGPFTEEEVENVKTVFWLIPLLVSIIGPILTLPINSDQFGLHSINTTKGTFDCAGNSSKLAYYAVSFIIIPVYRCILHPLVRKHIPNMLKVMGFGVFLCLVCTIIKLGIESIGHFYTNASHCIFHHTTTTGTNIVPIYWVVLIDALNGLGIIVTVCSMFEFVMAQSPNRMRGIMMGLCLTMIGLAGLIKLVLREILYHFETVTPSCVFYYYLVPSLLMLLILVVYVILAKRYKLRERGRHINIQAIVEEHYERYFDQQEKYERETANRH